MEEKISRQAVIKVTAWLVLTFLTQVYEEREQQGDQKDMNNVWVSQERGEFKAADRAVLKKRSLGFCTGRAGHTEGKALSIQHSNLCVYLKG